MEQRGNKLGAYLIILESVIFLTAVGVFVLGSLQWVFFFFIPFFFCRSLLDSSALGGTHGSLSPLQFSFTSFLLFANALNTQFLPRYVGS